MNTALSATPLTDFHGKNRVRCFNHTIQLSAKAILKPFSNEKTDEDNPERSDTGGNPEDEDEDDEEVPELLDVEEIESDDEDVFDSSSDDEVDADPEDDDGLNEMPIDEADTDNDEEIPDRVMRETRQVHSTLAKASVFDIFSNHPESSTDPGTFICCGKLDNHISSHMASHVQGSRSSSTIDSARREHTMEFHL